MLIVANAVFLFIFTIEALIRSIANGIYFAPDAYLRDGWNVLDLVVLVVTGASFALETTLDVGMREGAATVTVLRVLRIMRALRPLRLISKAEGMRVIINSLVATFPEAINVLVLAAALFFVFGIFGVQLLAGKLYSCNDTSVRFRSECIGLFLHPVTQVAVPRVWANARFSFNHIGSALVALCEVASLKWIHILFAAMDVTEVDEQPRRDASPGMALYLGAFVILGSFFIVQLFVGVLVDQFQKMDGTALLTPAQRRWVELERIIKRLKPLRPHTRPRNTLRSWCYSVVMHPQFENIITFMILVNTVFMASFHANQPQHWTDTLQYTNLVFLVVFAVEAVLKIAAWGRRYFSSGSNVFDFVVVAGSLASTLIPRSIKIGSQAARVFRVFRILRFAARSPGVKSLFRTLYLSLPSIGNLVLLMGLVVFIFAVVGNQLFGGTRYGGFLNHAANFQDIGHSSLTMFQMLAGDEWSQIMRDCQLTPPFCSTIGTRTDCGTNYAIGYFVSFYLLVVFIFLNLFVAVVLDSFRSSFNEEDGAISEFDFEEYKERWRRFDPEHLGWFPLWRLRDFMARLPPAIVITPDDRFGYLVIRNLVQTTFLEAETAYSVQRARKGSWPFAATPQSPRKIRRQSVSVHAEETRMPPFNALLFALCRFHSGPGALPYKDQLRLRLVDGYMKRRAAAAIIRAFSSGWHVRHHLFNPMRNRSSRLLSRIISRDVEASMPVSLRDPVRQAPLLFRRYRADIARYSTWLQQPEDDRVVADMEHSLFSTRRLLMVQRANLNDFLGAGAALGVLHADDVLPESVVARALDRQASRRLDGSSRGLGSPAQSRPGSMRLTRTPSMRLPRPVSAVLTRGAGSQLAVPPTTSDVGGGQAIDLAPAKGSLVRKMSARLGSMRFGAGVGGEGVEGFAQSGDKFEDEQRDAARRARDKLREREERDARNRASRRINSSIAGVSASPHNRRSHGLASSPSSSRRADLRPGTKSSRHVGMGQPRPQSSRPVHGSGSSERKSVEQASVPRGQAFSRSITSSTPGARNAAVLPRHEATATASAASTQPSRVADPPGASAGGYRGVFIAAAASTQPTEGDRFAAQVFPSPRAGASDAEARERRASGVTGPTIPGGGSSAARDEQRSSDRKPAKPVVPPIAKRSEPRWGMAASPDVTSTTRDEARAEDRNSPRMFGKTAHVLPTPASRKVPPLPTSAALTAPAAPPAVLASPVAPAASAPRADSDAALMIEVPPLSEHPHHPIRHHGMPTSTPNEQDQQDQYQDMVSERSRHGRDRERDRSSEHSRSRSPRQRTHRGTSSNASPRRRSQGVPSLISPRGTRPTVFGLVETPRTGVHAVLHSAVGPPSSHSEGARAADARTQSSANGTSPKRPQQEEPGLLQQLWPF